MVVLRDSRMSNAKREFVGGKVEGCWLPESEQSSGCCEREKNELRLGFLFWRSKAGRMGFNLTYKSHEVSYFFELICYMAPFKYLEINTNTPPPN